MLEFNVPVCGRASRDEGDHHQFCPAALSEAVTEVVFFILPCVLFSGMYMCGDLGDAGVRLLQTRCCLLLLKTTQNRTFYGKSTNNVSGCEVKLVFGFLRNG